MEHYIDLIQQELSNYDIRFNEKSKEISIYKNGKLISKLEFFTQMTSKNFKQSDVEKFLDVKNKNICVVKICNELNDLKLNDRVVFHEDKTPFTVKAINQRFAICTRPYNLKKTVFYTIIDFVNQIRSTNNQVFNNYDYKNQSDIERCLIDLESGEIELSRRNQVDLNIVMIHKR